jgi:SAM-dependent methyltransferase
MSEPASYVMGHNDRERRRLALQGMILNPFTEQLLRRAGVTSGMRVLDVGCGVGDVAMIAAALVGCHGKVTAIDIDAAALAVAQERAQERGLGNISFVHSTIEAYRPDHTWDAVVGRHILIHTPDPLGTLQKAWRMLHEGGVAVFQEWDCSVAQPAYPAWPLRETVFQLVRDVLSRMAHGDIGGKLVHLFLEADFTAPDCRVEYPIASGPDGPFFEWLAESLRSVFPRAEALGITRDLNLHLDTLAERLMEESVALRASCPTVPMVGGFARKR